MKRTKFDLIVYWLFFLFDVTLAPFFLLYSLTAKKPHPILFYTIIVALLIIWVILYKILKRFKHADVLYGFFGFSVIHTLIFSPMAIVAFIMVREPKPPDSFMLAAMLGIVLCLVIANFCAGFWSGWRLGRRGVLLSIVFFFAHEILLYLMVPSVLGIKSELIRIRISTILILAFVIGGSLVGAKLSKRMDKEQ